MILDILNQLEELYERPDPRQVFFKWELTIKIERLISFCTIENEIFIHMVQYEF